MTDMPPHEHPGAGFEDLDVSDRPDLSAYHVAFRFGHVGEDSQAAIAPFVPLSLSFSGRKVPAEMKTIHYGLHRDFWEEMQKPSGADRRALLDSALRRLSSDIAAWERGDESVLETTHFVRP